MKVTYGRDPENGSEIVILEREDGTKKTFTNAEWVDLCLRRAEGEDVSKEYNEGWK